MNERSSKNIGIAADLLAHRVRSAIREESGFLAIHRERNLVLRTGSLRKSERLGLPSETPIQRIALRFCIRKRGMLDLQDPGVGGLRRIEGLLLQSGRGSPVLGDPGSAEHSGAVPGPAERKAPRGTSRKLELELGKRLPVLETGGIGVGARLHGLHGEQRDPDQDGLNK